MTPWGVGWKGSPEHFQWAEKLGDEDAIELFFITATDERVKDVTTEVKPRT